MISIQQGGSLLTEALGEGIVFHQTSPSTWVASVKKLAEGNYFVAAGKLTGICDLHYDDKIAVNGGAEHGLQKTIINIGAPLAIRSANRVSVVTLSCYEKDGLPISVRGQPVIMTYFNGVAVHILRSIVDVLLAPLASVLFLLFTYMNTTSRAPLGSVGVYGDLESRRILFFQMFGIAAVLYSFSLSHFLRLLIANDTAFVVHAILRSFFGLSLGLLLLDDGRIRNIFVIGYVLTIFLIIGSGIIDPQLTSKYVYRHSLIWFVISWYPPLSGNLPLRKSKNYS